MAKPQTSFRISCTFTGREWDKETGLYYYRARYYDPMDGRFISKDPIGFKGGDMVLYGYVQSNPINFVDPTGLKVELCARSLSDFSGAAHAYILVNGSGAGFYPADGSIFYTNGKIYPETQQTGDSCVPINPPCGKEQQFEQCVKDEISGPASNYMLFFSNCHTWANNIISKCYRKALLN